MSTVFTFEGGMGENEGGVEEIVGEDGEGLRRALLLPW